MDGKEHELTRISTAFNHRTSVEIESEYDRLRAEARAEGDKMKRYYDEVRSC